MDVLEKVAAAPGLGSIVLPGMSGAIYGASGESLGKSLASGAGLGGLLNLTNVDSNFIAGSPKQKIVSILKRLAIGAARGSAVAGLGHVSGSDYADRLKEEE